MKNIESDHLILPKGETLCEKQYKDALIKLNDDFMKLSSDYTIEKQETMDYYSTWAHQIKTPISVISMFLDEEDTYEHRQIASEVFKIEQYVDMVLSYIRLRNNTSDFVFNECELDEIIRESIRKYAPQFINKKLTINYGGTNGKIVTDEKWLSFIIEQILSNAVKYTQTGGVTISVSDDFIIIIKDTGIGIATEDLPRIFEKGFTAYNGRDNKKSPGLGLYLCQKTADKLGIHISAYSKPGEGTSIILDLAPNFTKM